MAVFLLDILKQVASLQHINRVVRPIILVNIILMLPGQIALFLTGTIPIILNIPHSQVLQVLENLEVMPMNLAIRWQMERKTPRQQDTHHQDIIPHRVVIMVMVHIIRLLIGIMATDPMDLVMLLKKLIIAS